MFVLQSGNVRKIIHVLATMGLIIVLLLTNTSQVLADDPPAIPSNFYGEVHITDFDTPVAVGDQVVVFMNDTQVASTLIREELGQLVYTINVPGLATDENSNLEFKIAQGDPLVMVDRVVMTAVWHTGTNIEKNIHPPAVMLSVGAASEGAPVTVTAAAVDWGDDIASYAFDCEGDGTYAASSSSATTTCTFADNGIYTIGVSVLDDQDGIDMATTSVTVGNSAPTAVLGNNSPINEGGAATVSFTSPSDPSSVDLAMLHYAFSCDGASLDSATYETGGTETSTSCTYNTGPSEHTVRGRVIDKDGGYTEYTTIVSVLNVAPVISLTGASSLDEGTTFTGSGSFDDPGDDSWTATVNYGDGSLAENLSITDKSFTLGHLYALTGEYTITVTVSDGETTGSNTFVVTVNNVAPTGIFTAPSVNEGSDIVLTLSDAQDAGSPETFTYAFDCGSGLSEFDAANSTTCPTTDDGARSVVGVVRDSHGAQTSYSLTVTINNVAPQIGSTGGPYSTSVGTAISLIGAANCVSVDTCMIAWDLDNNGSYESENGASFVRDIAGDYIVGVQVTDDDGSIATATTTVAVGAINYSIVLQPGWNLVSFNLIPISADIDDVLSSISGSYDLVYAWDAVSQSWLSCDDVAMSPDDLEELDVKTGFWIHIDDTESVTLTMSGSIPTTTDIELVSGWNLIGFPAGANKAAADVDFGDDGSLSLVYAYHAGDDDSWKIWDSSAPSWVNDLEQFAPGWGYWVEIDLATGADSVTWTISYSNP